MSILDTSHTYLLAVQCLICPKNRKVKFNVVISCQFNRLKMPLKMGVIKIC